MWNHSRNQTVFLLIPYKSACVKIEFQTAALWKSSDKYTQVKCSTFLWLQLDRGVHGVVLAVVRAFLPKHMKILCKLSSKIFKM